MNSTTSKAIENLQAAMTRAMAIRPKVGGFPVLAETLRRAGLRRNTWHLPSVQSLYLTEQGSALEQRPAVRDDALVAKRGRNA